MLEADTGLLTWSLPLPPCYGHLLPAKILPDHRKEYLEYEGPVSGDRGSVARWDEGTFELLERDEAVLKATLHGGKLAGTLCMERSEEGAEIWRWLLL